MADVQTIPTLPEPARMRRRRRRRRPRGDAAPGLLLLAPATLVFLIFVAGPMLAAIGLSFFRWDLLSPAEFAGFSNYERLLHDGRAVAALRNTFLFALCSVVLHVGPGLALAVAVDRPMPRSLKWFLRTSFFFPLLISWAAVSLIWLYALDPSFGVVPHYARELGWEPPAFLTSPGWSMPAIIAVDLWHTIGFTFVVILAGLQAVPRHLYEAALIDGAGTWRRFWHVTVPLLSPTLLFSTVISFIGAFQIFEPMYVMTGGGPDDRTLSVVQYLYETGFRSFEMGYAATIALVVLAVTAVVTFFQFRLGRTWVHED